MRVQLSGAEVLGASGLEPGALVLDEGRIGKPEGGERDIDLSGFWIMPGIIDLHGDEFEHHLAPRRGAVRDLGVGLSAVEAALASSGITTAVLAQFYSWEGGMRGPEFARRLLAALRDSGTQRRVDMIAQLRVETRLPDGYAGVEALIEAESVRYVVFNDHVPHDALARGKRPPRLTGQALKSGRSPEAHLAMLNELHAQNISEPLERFAARLVARDVRLGSHDDETPEIRATYRAQGASIAEFPLTLAAAKAARAAGDTIILGAPNVLRGGSHKGNLLVVDLVAQGLCDALVSDYHYPSLVQAVFRLVDDGVLSLAQAWSLASQNPARILGLSDRGHFAPGARADLVVLDPATRRVEATISAGRFAYLSTPVAERILRTRR